MHTVTTLIAQEQERLMCPKDSLLKSSINELALIKQAAWANTVWHSVCVFRFQTLKFKAFSKRSKARGPIAAN